MQGNSGLSRLPPNLPVSFSSFEKKHSENTSENNASNQHGKQSSKIKEYFWSTPMKVNYDQL